jgi:phosphoribosylformylglycinamidine synthase
MDLKEAGNAIYLVGKFQPVFGGSHFDLITKESVGASERSPASEATPVLDEITPKVYKALHAAITAGLIRSAHDLSEGGLAIAAAEMCIGGRLGLDLTIEPSSRNLFGETTGCLLVEVRPEDAAQLEAIFNDLPLKRLGQVTAESFLQLGAVSLKVSDLTTAFNAPL